MGGIHKLGVRLLGVPIIGNILGLYGNNGKENGNYHNGLYRVQGLGF